MKSKILICGATGFIGRNLTEYFSKNENYEVHAVRFKRPEYKIKNVVWHQADLRNPDVTNEITKDMDIIIQAAATTSGAKDITTRPYIHVTDNAIMNSYLFRSAFENKVKQVIFFSCTVMYQSSFTPLMETDFNANISLHDRYFGVGNTKLYIEKMCDFYSRISNTKFTAIRHTNIYGPHDKFDLEKSHVFGATITKVMRAKDKITIWGSGDEERDLLYIDDLINFVSLALKNQKAKYRLYNCGYGSAIAIKNLVKKIVIASGKQLTIEHDLTQPTIKTSLSLNCKLALEELDWRPSTNLDLGIEKTLSWWKDNITEAN